MKKSFIAVAMVMAVFMMVFTSCSKDKSQLIIGKWSSMEGSYMTIDEMGKLDIPEGCYTFTFNNDNTCVISYSIMGIEEGEITSTYSINGDDLIIDGQEIDIEELSKQHLVLEFDSDSFFSDDDDEDEDESDNFKAHLEFKKAK